MGVIYIYGGYNLLPLGAGMAWRERGMVTRDRRKMERDMVGEMAARHRKERIFFFFFCGERGIFGNVFGLCMGLTY